MIKKQFTVEGFTLVEVLVVVTIVSILMGLIPCFQENVRHLSLMI
jgi:prepilin-type N-terminal cleavage/methylation domain-containing protein